MNNNNNQVQDIIQALEIEQLSPAEQDEILFDLNELVFKSTLLYLLEHLDDRAKSDFEKLLDEDASEEDIKDFIQAQGPVAGEALEESLRQLTNDILAVTK